MNINLSVNQEIKIGINNRENIQTMKQKGKYLELSNQNEVYYLNPENLLYVKADGNYCDIHLTDGDVLETLSFQRAEIARKIEEQLNYSQASKFSLIGRSYLVNIEHIMYINAVKQQLTFDINLPGQCKKKTIKASTGALRALRSVFESPSQQILAPINCTDADPLYDSLFSVSTDERQERKRRSFSGCKSGGFIQKLTTREQTNESVHCQRKNLEVPQKSSYEIQEDEILILGR